MKFVLTKLALGTLLLNILPSLSLPSFFAAQAAINFGQQEVNQDPFIIIASPRNQGAYNLTILEQLSNRRPCWQQNNDSAQTVNLLLLKFNFTGICGRSTDSNSYSLRMAGQDLGLVYTLRLVNRDNVLVLVGTPSRRSLPEVEIGRTQGLVAEPMRVALNPGWRLAKRTFKGTTLGHIYFATDTDLGAIAARNSRPTPTPTPSVPRLNPVQPVIPEVPPPEGFPAPTPPSPVIPPSRTPVPVGVPRPRAPVPPAPVNAAADNINQIYRDLLGREADPAGLAFYLRQLDEGRSLTDIRRAIANSPESQARQQLPAQPVAVVPEPVQPIPAPAPIIAPPITTPTPIISTSLSESNAYFVVVPSSQKDAAAVARQIWQLGIAWKDIAQRSLPRGPHVAVGPFGQRGAAEQMSTYLRGYGLDARVYFGR